MRNIQKEMQELFGSSCLCYSYGYLTNPTADVKELTYYVLEGWRMGYVDSDGYVSNPVGYLNLLGKKVKDIQKIKLSDVEALPSNDLYVVEYAYGNNRHFVVCNKYGVKFDPAGESNTVKNGKIISYRKLIY